MSVATSGRRLLVLVTAGAVLGVSVVSLINALNSSMVEIALAIVAVAGAALIIVVSFLKGRPGPSAKRVKFFNDSGSGKDLTGVSVEIAANTDGTGVLGTLALGDVPRGTSVGPFLPHLDHCRAYVFKYTRDDTAKKALVNVTGDTVPDTPVTDHDINDIEATFRMEAAGNWGVHGAMLYEEFQGEEQWDDDYNAYFQDANDS